MRVRRNGARLRLLAAASMAGIMTAQAAAAQEKAPHTPPTTVGEVTVTAPTTGTRTSIDRRSYTLGTDLQATNGSVADALRGVPSVEVDGQGTVTLRGDPNVQVMIDGKPSGTAAEALQHLPASQIERIEVITNPSAAFNPEGSAGIINLISKKGRGAGATGQVRAQVGDLARYNVGISGTYNADKLALNGDFGSRNFVENWFQTEDRSGPTFAGSGAASTYGVQKTHTGKVGATYDLTDKTRLIGSASYVYRPYSGTEQLDFVGATAAGAPLLTDRTGVLKHLFRISDVSAGYRQTFAGEGHELALDLRREEIDRQFGRDFTYAAGAPATGAFFGTLNHVNPIGTDFKAEYKRPLPGEAKLVIGYQHEIDDIGYDDTARVGANAAVAIVDPTRSVVFDYDQVLDAAYATYQRSFGDFTVLGGVRVESVEVNTLVQGTGARGQQDYVEVYPSLHLTYQLGETSQAKASYSRRVQRPNAGDLAPVRQIQGLNVFIGNPNLKPAFTDSFEAGYEYRKGPTSFLATLYYRSTDNAFTVISQLDPGGFNLLTRENLGTSNAAGLELVLGGKLTPKWTYSLNGNVAHTEIAAPNLGFGQTASGTSVSGRANLDWQATPKDFFQFNVTAFGKQVLPQGEQAAINFFNFGYRRTVNERLALTLTVKDVFKTFDGKVDLVSPTLTLHNRADFYDQHGVYFGLTYSLGGGKRRDEGFDFGAGGVG